MKSSSEFYFQPINDQRKPPSPFQTGLRYLKFLGQLKRQTEVQRTRSTVLERTPPFSTNYYAPLPSVCSHAKHKSIQVDDFDDLSFKTAISSLSFNEFLFTFLSLFLFVLVLLVFQLNSRPWHCLFDRTLWYSIDFSSPSYFCANLTEISLHLVQIDSTIYQIEVKKNSRANNCLGFDLLSCLPADHSLIDVGLNFPRYDQLKSFCNRTKQIPCSWKISPHQIQWNFFNDQLTDLYHCSCSNSTSCFHWMLKMNRCQIQIPWFDFCLKSSGQSITCQAHRVSR